MSELIRSLENVNDVQFAESDLDEVALRPWAGCRSIAGRFEEIWRETAM